MAKSTSKRAPSWKKNKTVWGRRYGRYKEELKKLNEASDSHQQPLSRKAFQSLWNSSGDLASKKSKAVELAKAQIYTNASPATARKLSQRFREVGISDDAYWDIATGRVSTADIADALQLNQKYHDKKDELMAQGMTASEASAQAKEYISWYYYGS